MTLSIESDVKQQLEALGEIGLNLVKESISKTGWILKGKIETSIKQYDSPERRYTKKGTVKVGSRYGRRAFGLFNHMSKEKFGQPMMTRNGQLGLGNIVQNYFDEKDEKGFTNVVVGGRNPHKTVRGYADGKLKGTFNVSATSKSMFALMQNLGGQKMSEPEKWSKKTWLLKEKDGTLIEHETHDFMREARDSTNITANQQLESVWAKFDRLANETKFRRVNDIEL